MGLTSEAWTEAWTRTRLRIVSCGGGGAGGSEPTPGLRILLLHGLGQDAASFREATTAMRAAAPEGSEFTLCQAPHDAVALSMMLASGGSGGSGGRGLQWWNMSPSSLGSGWAHSLDHLVKILELTGPFDGIVGFSQGAAALAMLVAEARLSQRRWFRFACFVGGFLPNAPHLRERIDKAVAGGGLFALPTWHCYGSDDFVIPSEKSHALASCFKDAVFAPHNGAHVVPRGNVLKGFGSFLELQKERLS